MCQARLYALQSGAAGRIERLVATLPKLLGDGEGALVALRRQAHQSWTGKVQLTCALPVHQFVIHYKVW